MVLAGGEGAERVWHAGGKQFNCSLVFLNRFINRRSTPLAKWVDSRQIDTSWLLKRVKAIVIESSSRSKNTISLNENLRLFRILLLDTEMD